MTRRISRAKQGIKASGVPFSMPAASERAERLAAVLHVLYLIFNEGYASTSGPELQRAELAAEAIRLARLLHRLLPDDGEVTGLLALMLLTDARRAARTGPHGELVPMAEQDRNRWDARRHRGGRGADHRCAAARPGRPYQLQAAIAARPRRGAQRRGDRLAADHGAVRTAAADLGQPVVALNHAVAVAMVRGPQAGLDLLAGLESDERIAGDHRLHAVRGHLLEVAGDQAGARDCYQAAARRATEPPATALPAGPRRPAGRVGPGRARWMVRWRSFARPLLNWRRPASVNGWGIPTVQTGIVMQVRLLGPVDVVADRRIPPVRGLRRRRCWPLALHAGEVVSIGRPSMWSGRGPRRVTR